MYSRLILKLGPMSRTIIIPTPWPNDVAMLTCKIQLLVIEILGTQLLLYIMAPKMPTRQEILPNSCPLSDFMHGHISKKTPVICIYSSINCNWKQWHFSWIMSYKVSQYMCQHAPRNAMSTKHGLVHIMKQQICRLVCKKSMLWCLYS